MVSAHILLLRIFLTHFLDTDKNQKPVCPLLLLLLLPMLLLMLLIIMRLMLL